MCSPGDREEGELGDTIEALQRVALYLGPQDEWYEEVGACSFLVRALFKVWAVLAKVWRAIQHQHWAFVVGSFVA